MYYPVVCFNVVVMPELLTFVETIVFSKRISALGLEEALRGLQLELLENPEAGDVEPGTAGLRKIRLGDPARGLGKRSGARAHYLWLPHRGLIYLMYIYGKHEASGLTPEQKKQLREVVAKIKRSGDTETRALRTKCLENSSARPMKRSNMRKASGAYERRLYRCRRGR